MYITDLFFIFVKKKAKMMIDTEMIKQLISEGKTDEAIRLLDAIIAQETASDEAYYLRGNAYHKQGEIRLALNNYLTAMDLNPESPARQAHNMLINIMNFFNKDMYNH